jgi:hypothetical protein
VSADVDVDKLISATLATAMTRLGELPGRAADTRPIGVGWATVDTERAERSFSLAFEPAAPDDALGSSCRLARRADGVTLVLLEPATEGRLARSLARFGEGPVAVWFTTPAALDGGGAPATWGPFGSERLVPGATPEGWFLFAVAPSGGDARGSAG